MRVSFVALLLLAITGSAFAASPERGNELDAPLAGRMAKLALACVQKEYPNKISHVMSSDTDVKPPRELTPAFYGCYDWHSSVHGHWLLVRLLRLMPNAEFEQAARTALRENLTRQNMETEAAYLRGPGRASFERPYGLAWFLQLKAELHEWDDPMARELAANLAPLEKAVLERVTTWLPKLPHPIRVGEHSQTAFALGLMLDYARVTGDQGFESLLTTKARKLYLADRACPLAYEPGGEDFLSPCIAEGDLMRRVLTRAEFEKWLASFLPSIPRSRTAKWLPPAVSPDPSDPKLAHLDGLNLSRAWMLNGLASALPAKDARRAALQATAGAHSTAGLAAVTGEHYEGGHWLASFAVYLITNRGIASR